MILGIFHPENNAFNNKTSNCRGNLTDISAKTITLVMGSIAMLAHKEDTGTNHLFSKSSETCFGNL